jgi:hypothetical protein
MRRELRSAFRRTRYRVQTGHDELVLHVDQPQPALTRLLQTSHAHHAVLLTAFNPRGRQQSRFANRLSQRRLGTELSRLGHKMMTGRNEDPHGRWPVEPTFLVLDLPLARAQRIAARHGQVAFLWMGADGVPRLVETGRAAPALLNAPRPTPQRFHRSPPVPSAASTAPSPSDCRPWRTC